MSPLNNDYLKWPIIVFYQDNGVARPTTVSDTHDTFSGCSLSTGLKLATVIVFTLKSPA